MSILRPRKTQGGTLTRSRPVPFHGARETAIYRYLAGAPFNQFAFGTRTCPGTPSTQPPSFQNWKVEDVRRCACGAGMDEFSPVRFEKNWEKCWGKKSKAGVAQVNG
jgi:hypothetical protein